MVIALLIFVAAGFLVAVTPGAVLGYFLVVVSRRLDHGARVALLLAAGAASSVMWLFFVTYTGDVLAVIVMGLSFVATLVSGFSFLTRETRRRHAHRFPPVVWAGYAPPVDPA